MSEPQETYRLVHDLVLAASDAPHEQEVHDAIKESLLKQAAEHVKEHHVTKEFKTPKGTVRFGMYMVTRAPEFSDEYFITLLKHNDPELYKKYFE